MTDKAKYKRVLLKISGQSLCRPGGSGLHLSAIASLVDELAPVVQSGIQVGLVVGGGNILRGRQLAHSERIHRVTADHMGMLATVINALALRDVLASRNMPACVLAAMEMTAVCEPFTQRRALEHLEAGRLVILAGGTGNPFFTTDTCAALRASENRRYANSNFAPSSWRGNWVCSRFQRQYPPSEQLCPRRRL